MRAPLRWMLGGSVALSALALWWPQDGNPAVVAAMDDSQAPALAKGEAAVPALPAHVAAALLDEAISDPFIGPQPPSPPAPSPPKPFVGPIYIPPPAPPAINYRYLGQMTDPDGKKLVYLARADKDVQVSTGTRLDEGYTVEAITAEGVRLFYAPAGARVTIPIPPAPVDSSSPVR